MVRDTRAFFSTNTISNLHNLPIVGLEIQVPVIFGVLTCLTDEQALTRAGIGANSHNHGIDWALTAIEQALMVKDSRKDLY